MDSSSTCTREDDMTQHSLRIMLCETDDSHERRRARTLRLRGELEDALGSDGRVELKRGDGPMVKGTKGDPITVGTIVVALISSGALTELIHRVFGHVKRERDEVDISTQNGTKITIRADDLESEHKRVAIEDTIRRAVAAAEGG
jgi:hypothetical protein